MLRCFQVGKRSVGASSFYYRFYMSTVSQESVVITRRGYKEPATIKLDEQSELSIRIDSPLLGMLYRRGTSDSIKVWLKRNDIVVPNNGELSICLAE